MTKSLQTSENTNNRVYMLTTVILPKWPWRSPNQVFKVTTF